MHSYKFVLFTKAVIDLGNFFLYNIYMRGISISCVTNQEEAGYYL